MKNLVGDIVYFKKENKKIFSIEVKYEKIKFTKNQYNNWFKENESTKPDYLIAITKKSLFIINWNKFIDIYNNSINRNFKGNYSPEIKEIILISSCVKNVEFFDLEIDDKEIEIKINKILKNMTNKIKERMLYDK